MILGVRDFAIFFDDISGEGTNPVKQTELLNRLTDEFVKVKGDVSPLTVCPTDYSKLWANPTPQGSLAIYGNTLNPDIKIFWTGDVVCSDLTRKPWNGLIHVSKDLHIIGGTIRYKIMFAISSYKVLHTD